MALAVSTAAPAAAVPAPEPDWIAVEVVGRAGEVLAGRRIEARLPDGARVGAVLDERGRALFEGIAPGECTFFLPAGASDTTGADAVTAFVFDPLDNANVTGGSPGTAVSGPYEESFAYADAWLPTEASTGSGPRASCVATGAPAGLPDASYAELTGWNSGIGARPELLVMDLLSA